MTFELYVIDLETTGLDFLTNDPIEISIQRLSTGDQKTWFVRPIDLEHISTDALRVNGHKIEDLRGQTKYGKEIYMPADKVAIEVENWLASDNMSSGDRLICGQNVSGFDKAMLLEWWKKCGSADTFPFNNKYVIDTMLVEFILDYCKGTMAKGYSLHALTKKYGVKNEKAHSAEFDVIATSKVFKAQMDVLKKHLAVSK